MVPVDLALSQDILDLLATVVVVAGLTVCLLGLRVWPGVCCAAGFVLAGLAGASFAFDRAPERIVIVYALGAAAGVVGAIAGRYAHRLMTIAAYAGIGWYIGSHVGEIGGLEVNDQLACALGGAMIVAVMAVLFDLIAVMLLGAAAGAWAAVWGASLFFGSPFAAQLDAWTLLQKWPHHQASLIAVGAIAVCGLFVQGFAYIHAGPDPREVAEALDRADLPRKRRVAMLDELRSDGTITRTEYWRHLVRILSGG